jgi:hypothetical protein
LGFLEGSGVVFFRVAGVCALWVVLGALARLYICDYSLKYFRKVWGIQTNSFPGV